LASEFSFLWFPSLFPCSGPKVHLMDLLAYGFSSLLLIWLVLTVSSVVCFQGTIQLMGSWPEEIGVEVHTRLEGTTMLN
jgi:hypothetical protein